MPAIVISILTAIAGSGNILSVDAIIKYIGLLLVVWVTSTARNAAHPLAALTRVSPYRLSPLYPLMSSIRTRLEVGKLLIRRITSLGHDALQVVME